MGNFARISRKHCPQARAQVCPCNGAHRFACQTSSWCAAHQFCTSSCTVFVIKVFPIKSETPTARSRSHKTEGSTFTDLRYYSILASSALAPLFHLSSRLNICAQPCSPSCNQSHKLLLSHEVDFGLVYSDWCNLTANPVTEHPWVFADAWSRVTLFHPMLWLS